jgi:hypothetical protein
MVLVTQSFGNENEYRRAIFAIWSFWAHHRSDVPVVLFTDQPAFFQSYFQGQQIQYVLLTPQKIKSMRGEIDFLHRMKIALIDETFEISKSDLIYVDSDTFFITNPASYVSEMENGISLMHLPEYPFAAMRAMPLPAATQAHAYLDLLENRKFKLADGTSIDINPNLYSWNAGVMFLPNRAALLLPDVYSLTDQFYPPTKNHAAEQFAFSIVLQMKSRLASCEKSVYHYWYRVKKIIMDKWLLQTITLQWAALPANQKTEKIKTWTSSLPDHLANHILCLRDDAIQAFNENNFSAGYKNAWRAFIKQPLNKRFCLDVLYHTKRFLHGAKN